MTRPIAALLFLTLSCFLLTAELHACPFCDGGESGRNEVKEIIFGPDFGRNVIYTLLPFLVFAGVGLLVHFGFPRWPVAHRERSPVTSSLRDPKET